MPSIIRVIEIKDKGRAVRPTFLLLKPFILLVGVLLLIGLAMPAYANSKKRDGRNWWLQVVSESSKELLVSVPMPIDAGWCLAWNHSVEGFTVHDCYRNKAGRMMLKRSHLPDFAAGLDHIPGRGRQVSDGYGGYWIEDINEAVPSNRYRLRVGSRAVNHRLVSHGEPSLERLLNDAAQSGCPTLTPGLEAGTEAGTKAETEPGAEIISLSALAANHGVTVQLVASTSCDHGAPSQG